MLRWTLSSSLRFGRLVAALAVGLMVFGIVLLALLITTSGRRSEPRHEPMPLPAATPE